MNIDIWITSVIRIVAKIQGIGHGECSSANGRIDTIPWICQEDGIVDVKITVWCGKPDTIIGIQHTEHWIKSRYAIGIDAYARTGITAGGDTADGHIPNPCT